MRQPRQTTQTEIGASPFQKFHIARMLRILGVRREYEQQRMTMAEAGVTLRYLAREIKLRRRVRDDYGKREQMWLSGM